MQETILSFPNKHSILPLPLDSIPDVTLNVPLHNQLCEGDSLLISIAPDALHYEWYLNNLPLGQNNHFIYAKESGTYLVIASNGNCNSKSELVQVDFYHHLNLNLNVEHLSFLCQGDSLLLEVESGGDEYNWFFEDEPIVGENTHQLYAQDFGVYAVQAYNGPCFSESEEIKIKVYSYPPADLSVPIFNRECEGDTFRIEALHKTAEFYHWYKDFELIAESVDFIDVVDDGIYHLEIANGASGECQTISNKITASFVPPPSADLSMPVDTSICENEVLKVVIPNGLYPIGAMDYLWYKDGALLENTQNAMNISEAGNYFVRVFNGNCGVTSEAFNVAIQSKPNIAITSPLWNGICEGQSLIIEASSDVQQLEWYHNQILLSDVGTTIEVNSAGTYYAIASNDNCSSISDNVQLEVYDFPDLTLNIPLQNTICEGDSLIISVVEGAASYTWSMNDSILSINANSITATEVGNYYVMAQNGHCLDTSELVLLDVLMLPIFTITPSQINFCEGETSIIALEDNFDDYQWYRNEVPIPGANNPILEITESGAYKVEIFLSGCSQFSNVITANEIEVEAPTVEISGSLLIASNASSYQWFFNGDPIAGAIMSSFNATDSGDYFVEVIDQNGCLARSETVFVIISSSNDIEDYLHIRIYPNPTVGILYLECTSYSNHQFIQIEIIDQLDRVYLSEKLINSDYPSYKIDLAELPIGIYWIKLLGLKESPILKKVLKL